MGIFKLDDGRYRVQIRRKGFPRYDHVFSSHSDAQQAMDAILGKMKDPLVAAEEMTLATAWEKYHYSAEFARKSPRTQHTEEGRIKPVLVRLGGYSLANLSARPEVVLDYIDERSRVISEKTKRKLSSTSIRLEVAALSAVAIWAVSRRLIRKNFVQDVKRPGQAKRKRRVPQVEQGKLQFMALQNEDPMMAQGARFLLLLRLLGCRPGELAGLLRSDVRFGQRDVTFRQTKHKAEDRLVHVTESAAKYLDAQYQFAREHAPGSPYLFSTRKRQQASHDGPQWVPYNYSWIVRRMRAEGVVGADFHSHAMRREFISRAVESGLPYSTIRKQTGHHSTQAIEIYDEGLSTAPEIRAALDAHDHTVGNEAFEGLLAATGLNQEQIQMLLQHLDRAKKGPISRVGSNGEVIPITRRQRRKE